MTMQDPLADMLTRIRNAQQVKIKEITMPSSSTKVSVAEVLKQEGFIENFEASSNKEGKAILSIVLKYFEGRPVIEEIKRLSRPGLRQYKHKDAIPEIRGGLGIIILSTNKGEMNDRPDLQQGVGGELLCSLF